MKKNKPKQSQSVVPSQPPFSVLSGLFYFLEAVSPAFVNTAALLDRPVPGIRAFEVFRPERPDSALARPDRIYDAPFLTIDSSQEYTIFSNRLLNNRRSKPDPLEVFPP